MNFKVNEIVVLNKEAKFGDMTKNSWSGCQTDTLDFLKHNVPYQEEWKIVKVGGSWVELDGCLRKNGTDDFLLVNKNILVLAPYKLVTKEQLQKEVGYNFKIVEEVK
jgi:hypothetical protein